MEICISLKQVFWRRICNKILCLHFSSVSLRNMPVKCRRIKCDLEWVIYRLLLVQSSELEELLFSVNRLKWEHEKFYNETTFQRTHFYPKTGITTLCHPRSGIKSFLNSSWCYGTMKCDLISVNNLFRLLHWERMNFLLSSTKCSGSRFHSTAAELIQFFAFYSTVAGKEWISYRKQMRSFEELNEL